MSNIHKPVKPNAHPVSHATPFGLLLCAAAALLVGCGGSSDDKKVTIQGTAYKFNKPFTRIAGATVSVAELPDIKATTDGNGAYTLTVPAGVRVTPFIEASGYSKIYLQSFTLDGDLVNANFQTPDTATFNGLYGLLTQIGGGVKPDATGCVIVSTVSVSAIRNLSIDQFLTFGAHGYAGAQATIAPQGGNRVYFNANVLPDPRETATTRDGGVVWINVPAGIYTLTASDAAKPEQKFASFTADCQLGRVINANPPQGMAGL